MGYYWMQDIKLCVSVYIDHEPNTQERVIIGYKTLHYVIAWIMRPVNVAGGHTVAMEIVFYGLCPMAS